jgi:hypothetical protein
MPVLSEGWFTASNLLALSGLIAGSAALALVLLVAWVGLLYFRVLRLTGKDRAYGLSVLEELTNLIKAASELATFSSKRGE